MTSPTRPRSPTRTTSNIFAPTSPSAMTTGPLTLAMTPMELLLPRNGQGHAEHSLRQQAEALDLVLPVRGRHEDDERTERRFRVLPLALGQGLGDGLARNHEAELVGIDDPTELGRRRRRSDLEDVLEADQSESDGELSLAQHDSTTGVDPTIGHGDPGGELAYLTVDRRRASRGLTAG